MTKSNVILTLCYSSPGVPVLSGYSAVCAEPETGHRGPGTAPQGTAHPVTSRPGVVTILLVILIALLAALTVLIVAYRRRRHRQTA
jgi:hypothetical protein